jgi:UDP-N-acetylglucosamine--N-acetylmuramyl-(pentapeptide) pyrophosphoryl-undecaprenol N-acetylglucosamine transferase
LLGIAPGSPIVLIFGGSRGALAVNQAILEMLPQMVADDTVHYVYVTGAIYFERVQKSVQEQIGTLPAHIHLHPYLHEMPEVMAATRVMIGRAGASTLAELTALGIPSILIPSPNVTNNHQEKNALALVAAGAAEMIRERELSGTTLFARLQQILHAPQRLKSMSQQAEQLGKPDALDCLFHELERIIEARRKRG